MLFPYKRTSMLNAFLTTIQKTHSVDAQSFWELREFYYPGSLTVTHGALYPHPFTTFQSKYITSNEYLVTQADLSTLHITNHSVHIDEGKDTVKLTFVKPIAEMVKANGFLDYKDKDKKLLEGKFWLVITHIQR